MEQEKIEITCRRALETWGKIHQFSMVLEEMAELQIELLKNMNRDSDNVEKITDECADVEVVLNYVKLYFGIKEEVKERVEFKINRLEKRLDEWDGKQK